MNHITDWRHEHEDGCDAGDETDLLDSWSACWDELRYVDVEGDEEGDACDGLLDWTQLVSGEVDVDGDVAELYTEAHDVDDDDGDILTQDAICTPHHGVHGRCYERNERNVSCWPGPEK